MLEIRMILTALVHATAILFVYVGYTFLANSTDIPPSALLITVSITYLAGISWKMTP